MLKQFFQSDKNLFIKEVASYFQNFLETDFRKRRLPKRSIKSTDTNGNQITINLLKYTSFRKKILTDSLKCQVVGCIGKILILFRQNKDKDKQKIKI